MANRYFTKLIQKIPLGHIDFTQMFFDFVTSDNIDFENASVIGDISNVTTGITNSVLTQMVSGVREDYLVVPQSTALQFTMPNDIVVQGMVTFDKNNNLISFIDFGNLREYKSGDVFTLDLPSELFRVRGNIR